jgi:hypothetical protein
VQSGVPQEQKIIFQPVTSQAEDGVADLAGLAIRPNRNCASSATGFENDER